MNETERAYHGIITNLEIMLNWMETDFANGTHLDTLNSRIVHIYNTLAGIDTPEAIAIKTQTETLDKRVGG